MWKVVSKFTYIKEKELTYGIDSVSDSQIFFQIRIQIIKVNILSQNFFKWCFSYEFEFICKTVLAHESGDPGVQFNEKNRGSKISWHCLFNNLVFVVCK
jgi:hypothetical protein